jgi:hypothetical protein
VYTKHYQHTTITPKPHSPTLQNMPLPHNIPPEQPRHHNNRDPTTQLSLSISGPKIDFPAFAGEEPFNWLRQCEKYFSPTNVPIESWVPLATLHCSGPVQTWWRSLRTPTNYVHWAQFCNMVSNHFSSHSSHSSSETFHHLKQSSSVTYYFLKFKDMMALIQMDYPDFT